MRQALCQVQPGSKVFMLRLMANLHRGLRRNNRRVRMLLGISLLWLPLSMLLDGMNTLILPRQLIGIVPPENQASVLGLLSFSGLLAGLLVQPFAGAFSDRLRPHRGRLGFIGVGILFTLLSLLVFALVPQILIFILAYLSMQVMAGVTQAGQQAFIPDLVPNSQRGLASGMKNLMDVGGAMLGFILIGQLLGSGSLALALGAVGFLLLLVYLLSWLLLMDYRGQNRPAPQPVTQENLPIRSAFKFDLREHRALGWLVISRFMFLTSTYAVGRFLLYFVAERLGLGPNQAAKQAGILLAGLALLTVMTSPISGWAADRFGRIPLMVAGAVMSMVSVLLLIYTDSAGQILLFGALMSFGSAAFSTASWAMTADLVPSAEAARFFGLANIGTAGAAAVAGLLGPLVDWVNRFSPGTGYPALFILAAVVFLGSVLPLKLLRPHLSPSSAGALGSPEPLLPISVTKSKKTQEIEGVNK